MKLLLCKSVNSQDWRIPRYIVQQDEMMEDAANQIVLQYTGQKTRFIKQYQIWDTLKFAPELNDKGQLISVGYYGLTGHSIHNIQKLEESFKWFDIHRLPDLKPQEEMILQTAIDTLKYHINKHPIFYHLMPREFTMPAFHQLFELILNRQLDRRNFHRKIIDLGILKKTGKTLNGGAHKAPDLYSFNLKRYNEILDIGYNKGFL